MAAYYYQDAAAAAHYGPCPIGVPPWVPSYVAGGAPAATAAAQPPSREVPPHGREGDKKSPEEMANDLLSKLDEQSMWKLAKELLDLGLVRVAKMEAVGMDAEGSEGEDGRVGAAGQSPPPRYFTGPPPPGSAAAAAPPLLAMPPPPDEWGSVPQECQVQYPSTDPYTPHPHPHPDPHHQSTPVGDMPFEARKGQPRSPSRGLHRPVGHRPRPWGQGSVKRCSQLQMLHAMQEHASYASRVLGGPVPPMAAAPWDLVPPMQGMPLPPPAAMPAWPADHAPSLRQPRAQIQLAKQLPPQAKEAGRRSQQRVEVDDEDHEGAQEGQGPLVDEATATTMILRNLPPTFTQQGTQEWLDEKGYKGKYDFALFFPARKTSRLSIFPYAFVNFLTLELAQEFKGQFHLSRFSGEPCSEVVEDNGKQAPPLSVVAARRQGFSENYVRFSHLLDDTRSTQCRPFFADESIKCLSKDELEAAQKQAQQVAAENLASEAPCTTFIVRNLPLALSDQDAAREWLDSKGFKGEYDFFIWFPEKKQRKAAFAADAAEQPQGMGYFFVNFKDAAAGQKCKDDLDGQQFDDSGERLNVVAARKQGLDELLRHFGNLGEGGRVAPWVATDRADRSSAQASCQ
ncbi:unnamed protein product [Prorocentrum cordatum]|uniref:RRM domain-containing protein n=1 Tax=Prorocentrum cordatum TaxID=2364126 RepID=A0ABN9SYS2_9DINO|nr:unnamed protein product [Polarella glacialis]